MSKEDGSFAVAGKFLKLFMLICLQKSPFCPFLSLNSTWKVGFPPFILKIFPPFCFPQPIFFFRFPPFWNFQNLGSPLLKGGGDTPSQIFKCMEMVTQVAFSYQQFFKMKSMQLDTRQEKSKTLNIWLHATGNLLQIYRLKFQCSPNWHSYWRSKHSALVCKETTR